MATDATLTTPLLGAEGSHVCILERNDDLVTCLLVFADRDRVTFQYNVAQRLPTFADPDEHTKFSSVLAAERDLLHGMILQAIMELRGAPVRSLRPRCPWCDKPSLLTEKGKLPEHPTKGTNVRCPASGLSMKHAAALPSRLPSPPGNTSQTPKAVSDANDRWNAVLVGAVIANVDAGSNTITVQGNDGYERTLQLGATLPKR